MPCRPREGVVEHWPIAPVGAELGGLPDVLDVVGVTPGHKGLQVLLDSGHDGERPLGERGATEPVQARLACVDAHDHEADALRRGADRSDVGYLHPPSLPLPACPVQGGRPGARAPVSSTRPTTADRRLNRGKEPAVPNGAVDEDPGNPGAGGGRDGGVMLRLVPARRIRGRWSVAGRWYARGPTGPRRPGPGRRRKG